MSNSNVLHLLISSINKEYSNCQISERNKTVEISFKTKVKLISEYEKVVEKLAELPERDDVQIVICDSVDDKIKIHRVPECKNEFLSFIDTKEREEELDVKILVNKKVVDDRISVYKFSEFSKFILSLSDIQIIECIEEDIGNSERLIFEVFDEDIFISTKTLMIRHINNDGQNEEFKRSERIEECRKNTNVFWQTGNMPIPDDFHVIATNAQNPFKEAFLRIESLLSMIYISDISKFSKDLSTLYCQIIGQRMNEHKIELDNIQHNSTLYDIYSWIYTDGNIVDKIALARNLLSMQCRNIPLYGIDENAFGSIKVNFSLYQKENVEQYIRMKNEMTKFVQESVSQYRDVVLRTVEDLGKNIIAYCSFMLTIFAANIINGTGLTDIFSKDVTYMSYIVVAGSIAFMIICYWLSDFNINRINESYELIKENNDFFRGSREYEEIFNDEKIRKRESEAKKYRRRVFWGWGILIFLIYILVEVLSEYSFIQLVVDIIDLIVETIHNKY